MSFQIQPPLPEREEVYNKYVKPLLNAAIENKALDKWMFNLSESNEVNYNSVVYVSTKYKIIFIIKGIRKTESRPKFSNDDSGIQKRRFYNMVHGLPPRVKMQRSNITSQYEPETWKASLIFWDISNGRYIGNSLDIRSGCKIPSLEELSQDLDFDLWIKITNSYCTYQRISKKAQSIWNRSRFGL